MRNRRNIRRRQWTPVLFAALVIAGIGSEGDAGIQGIGRDAEPLKSLLHLRIDDPANPARRNLRLDQEGALPLKAHDRFRIEAKLNRPAYLYVFWIGSDGKVGPIYPWTRGDWDRPAREVKTDRLDLPPKTDKAWEIPAGDPGLEAVVLLAREDSPLPREREPTSPSCWSARRLNAPEPRQGGVDRERPGGPRLDPDDHRHPSGAPCRRRPARATTPVLRFRRLLQDKVQPLGDYSQAVVFPNQGGD